MDEPCSALDPIATAKIEELISELRSEYTIVIYPSMQQAARVSDRTAYFHLGKLVEVGKTRELSSTQFTSLLRIILLVVLDKNTLYSCKLCDILLDSGRSAPGSASALGAEGSDVRIISPRPNFSAGSSAG